MHSKHSQQDPQPRHSLTEAGLRAARRARRDWVLELHNAFRPAQEEAFEQWDAWQQALEEADLDHGL
jgi:hypothetical protein